MDRHEKRLTIEQLASLDEAGKMFVLGYMTGRMERISDGGPVEPDNDPETERKAG